MMMTEDGLAAWLRDRESPDRIIATVLAEHAVLDWPLPTYLLDHLTALAAVEKPNQTQVDEARIP